MLAASRTDSRFVGVHEGQPGAWECDCVCGWSSHRLRFASRYAAKRAAAMHARICPLLHH